MTRPSLPEQRNNVPYANNYERSIVLCAVCDIRDFTDLTSRVDRYVRSRYTPKSKSDELFDAYVNYISATQRRAKILLTNSFKSEHYALKATGDGYMMALKLARWGSSIYDRKNDKIKKAISNRVSTLTKNVCILVEDSLDLSSGAALGSIASATHQFFVKWGKTIGRDPEWLSGTPSIATVGAISIGLGIIWPGLKEKEALQPTINTSEKRPSGEANPAISYGDAFGHSINLTFRLCDKAGRKIDNEPGEWTPLILVDRRVATVLMSLETEYIHSCYSVNPANIDLHMKGIEEKWCYSVERDNENIKDRVFKL